MTNLCLVVVAAQFQETKKREAELLKQSRSRGREISVTSMASTSTASEEGCYTQILKYIEDSCKRLARHLNSWINMEKSAVSKRCREKSCIKFRRRKNNVKSIHHHHDHYHYLCHCANTRTHQPCSSEIPDSPHTPSGPRIFEMFSNIPPSPDHVLGITQDTQDPRSAKEGNSTLMINDVGSSRETVSTATANINVQGHDTSASVVTYR